MTRAHTVRTTERRISTLGVKSKRLPVGRPGTILFAMYASVGEVAILGLDASWNQAILGFGSERADPSFLHYWLESLRPHLAQFFRSNTQDNLNAEQVSNLPFPVIALEAQSRIADFLDTETARVDAAIVAKRRMIGLLSERDLVVLSDYLVPDGVQLARLGFFASLQSGLIIDGSRVLGPDAVTMPYLRVANVQAGWVDLQDITTVTVPAALAARSTLRPGDVLMTEGGDLDKLGRGTLWEGQLPNCLHQNHVFAVRADQSRLDPAYLALLTRTLYARHHFESTGVRTTNLASTNTAKILDMPIPVVPVDEQRRLVERYQACARTTNGLIASLNRQIELLRERRRALITAAVSGQLEIAKRMP